MTETGTNRRQFFILAGFLAFSLLVFVFSVISRVWGPAFVAAAMSLLLIAAMAEGYGSAWPGARLCLNYRPVVSRAQSWFVGLVLYVVISVPTVLLSHNTAETAIAAVLFVAFVSRLAWLIVTDGWSSKKKD